VVREDLHPSPTPSDPDPLDRHPLDPDPLDRHPVDWAHPCFGRRDAPVAVPPGVGVQPGMTTWAALRAAQAELRRGDPAPGVGARTRTRGAGAGTRTRGAGTLVGRSTAPEAGTGALTGTLTGGTALTQTGVPAAGRPVAWVEGNRAEIWESSFREALVQSSQAALGMWPCRIRCRTHGISRMANIRSQWRGDMTGATRESVPLVATTCACARYHCRQRRNVRHQRRPGPIRGGLQRASRGR